MQRKRPQHTAPAPAFLHRALSRTMCSPSSCVRRPRCPIQSENRQMSRLLSFRRPPNQPLSLRMSPMRHRSARTLASSVPHHSALVCLLWVLRMPQQCSPQRLDAIEFVPAPLPAIHPGRYCPLYPKMHCWSWHGLPERQQYNLMLSDAGGCLQV